MTEPTNLVLINEVLRRANRRWKTLAVTLGACFALAFILLIGFATTYTVQVRVNRELRAANAALARAYQACAEANSAANPGQPR